MITYPPALRRTGFVPPRAIRHFSDAIAEARAAEPSAPRPIRPASPTPALAPRPVPAHRTVIRLWLPLSLLFLLLAPLAILLSPLLYFAPPNVRPSRPLVSVFVLGRALLALSGTDVDVDTRDARIRIRIF
jgi:hypothetical protein